MVNYLTGRAVWQKHEHFTFNSHWVRNGFRIISLNRNNYQRLTISRKKEKVIDTVMTTQTIYDIHF